MQIIIFTIAILAIFFIWARSKIGRKLSGNEFDIIIIGAGSGGLNAASFMNKAGFKTLLIDKSDRNIGGDCLNFGCVPSKALIHVARMIKNGRDVERFGLKTDGTVDIGRVVAYIKEKQDTIREDENFQALSKKGITVKLGLAKFISSNTVILDGQEYKARKIIIATGSRPKELDIPGIKDVPNIFTNETIFDINFLPKKMVVIGGGPIGMELGQAFKYLGSDVSVVVKGDSILNKEDPEVSRFIFEKLSKDGIRFYLNSQPEKIADGNKIVIKVGADKEVSLEFDALLVAVGRFLNTEGLDLEKAGVEMEGGKIKVDSYLRTTNKKVFLVGDIAGQHQFTHAAELHAKLVLRNFFSPFKKKLETDKMSWVTYTDPEIATFGLNGKDLNKKQLKYLTIRKSFKNDDRAIVDESTEGMLKLFISSDKKILGGTMAAKNAGEMIQELILANSAGLKINTLFNKIYPYPVASRINRKAVSEHMAGQLTPFVKKLLRILY
ncbi:MAG: FAD-dependent oxidoreductase [Candidatus Yanofskybacteria bacterium]|nr:FAD-dependent oxidoreductase [Candidatus Yanofskybacteria bacterium]